jgi:hypothetical protein
MDGSIKKRDYEGAMMDLNSEYIVGRTYTTEDYCEADGREHCIKVVPHKASDATVLFDFECVKCGITIGEMSNDGLRL